jgi:ATP-dependent Clp protease ATP-binding subunit ClpA
VDAAALRSRLPRGGTGETDAPEMLDAEALASLGIDLDAVRRATDAAFGRGALERAAGPRRARRRGITGPRMTAGAKRAIERAMHMAVRHRDRQISSGHLLLGILDQPGSPAVEALLAAGVDIEDLRADVLRRMAIAA